MLGASGGFHRIVARLAATTAVLWLGASGVEAQDATWVGGNGPVGETNGWEENPN